MRSGSGKPKRRIRRSYLRIPLTGEERRILEEVAQGKSLDFAVWGARYFTRSSETFA